MFISKNTMAAAFHIDSADKNDIVIATVSDPNWGFGFASFDENRVFAPGILAAGGKYYLFFDAVPKPMTALRTPTSMGIAIASSPRGPWKKFAGPYVRYKGNPVVASGHEVLIWRRREGVAALVDPTGPDRNTIQYAPDGLHFSVISHFQDPPMAPGAFRPDAFDNTRFGKGIQWGISMVNGKDPYLVRYECAFSVTNTRP